MAFLLAPESRLGNGFGSEVEHSDLSDEQLKNLIKEIRKSKCSILAENRIIEKCFENDESFYSQTPSAKPSVSSLKDVDGSGYDKSRRRSTRTSTSASLTGTNSDVFKVLSFEQKCEIAVLSIRILQKEIEMMHKQKEKEIDRIQIQLEEIDARYCDITSENALFRKLIVEEGFHPITSQLRSEKVDQYFRYIFKRKDLQIERCRLGIETLRNKYKFLKKKLDEDDFIASYALEIKLLKIENSELETKCKQTEVEFINAKKEYHKVLDDLEKNKRTLKLKCSQNETAKKNVGRSQRILAELNNEIKKKPSRVT